MIDVSVPNLAKSALRLSASMPIWSAQQMVNLVVPSKNGVDEATKAFHTMADSASKGISNQPLSTLASVSERIPSMLIDSSQRLMNPQKTVDTGMKLVHRSMDAAKSSLSPVNVGVAVSEIRNRAEVFFLVAQSKKILEIQSPAPDPFPLASLVEKAYEQADFQILWALEGLGQEYATSFFKDDAEPTGILQGAVEAALPAKSLSMLHAGMGQSFAQKLLEDIDSNTQKSDLKEILSRFISLCHDNAQPEHIGAALESLGFVVRTSHSNLMSTVDEVLQEGDDASDLRGYFWHGAGRALYFIPINFLPFSDWQIFEMVRLEAPKEHLNSALAGVAWSFVLVNNKSPQVLSNLLLEKHGEDLAQEPGFINGVESAMILRQDTTPDSQLSKDFYQYDPTAHGEQVVEHWRSLVRQPSERAIAEFWPSLNEQKKIGSIFKYTDLAEASQESKPVVKASAERSARTATKAKSSSKDAGS